MVSFMFLSYQNGSLCVPKGEFRGPVIPRHVTEISMGTEVLCYLTSLTRAGKSENLWRKLSPIPHYSQKTIKTSLTDPVSYAMNAFSNVMFMFECKKMTR